MRIRRVVLLASLIVGFSSIAAAQAKPSPCETFVSIELDVEMLRSRVGPQKASVCQGGWVIWRVVNNTNEERVKVKLTDWKVYATEKKADVTQFKHFGPFGGSEDETQATGGGATGRPSATVLVARAYYEGFEGLKAAEVHRELFKYTIVLKIPGTQPIEIDPELEIVEPVR